MHATTWTFLFDLQFFFDCVLEHGYLYTSSALMLDLLVSAFAAAELNASSVPAPPLLLPPAQSQGALF